MFFLIIFLCLFPRTYTTGVCTRERAKIFREENFPRENSVRRRRRHICTNQTFIVGGGNAQLIFQPVFNYFTLERNTKVIVTWIKCLYTVNFTQIHEKQTHLEEFVFISQLRLWVLIL